LWLNLSTHNIRTILIITISRAKMFIVSFLPGIRLKEFSIAPVTNCIGGHRIHATIISQGK
jgi:hypothetical protein